MVDVTVEVGETTAMEVTVLVRAEVRADVSAEEEEEDLADVTAAVLVVTAVGAIAAVDDGTTIILLTSPRTGGIVAVDNPGTV